MKKTIDTLPDLAYTEIMLGKRDNSILSFSGSEQSDKSYQATTESNIKRSAIERFRPLAISGRNDTYLYGMQHNSAKNKNHNRITFKALPRYGYPLINIPRQKRVGIGEIEKSKQVRVEMNQAPQLNEDSLLGLIVSKAELNQENQDTIICTNRVKLCSFARPFPDSKR